MSSALEAPSPAMPLATTTPVATPSAHTPPTSRIPKPSPVPLRRSLSLRLRGDPESGRPPTDADVVSGGGGHRGGAGDNGDDASGAEKPYNCARVEEGGDDAGGGDYDDAAAADDIDDLDSSSCSTAVNSSFGAGDLVLPKSASFDASTAAVESSVAANASPPPPSSMPHTHPASPRGRRQPSAASAATAAPGYCTAPKHAKSLQHLNQRATSTPTTPPTTSMAHNCSNCGGTGAHRKRQPGGRSHYGSSTDVAAAAAGGSGSSTNGGGQQSRMSLDLKQCTSHHQHSHRFHETSPCTAIRSANPSPLLQRRASSVSRATSYARSTPLASRPTPPSQTGTCIPLSINGPSSHCRHPTPKTPPVSPDDPLFAAYTAADDDLDSVCSYTSLASRRSTMSCDHSFVGHNGTTFSGRSKQYVVHCSSYAGQSGPNYLTPTQRLQKSVARLKVLLKQATADLHERDNEIFKLTHEVVELRLFKKSLQSPEERSASSDAVTVREMGDPATSTDVSPLVIDPMSSLLGANGGGGGGGVDESDGRRTAGPMGSDDCLSGSSSQAHPVMSKSVSPRHYSDAQTASFLDKMSHCDAMQSSFADSGHFDDLTCASSVHSRDSYVQTQPMASSATNTGADGGAGGAGTGTGSGSSYAGDAAEFERSELIRFYELKIEDLIRNHSNESQEVRVTYNDRLEALTLKLGEANAANRDMRPDYEQARDRIRELERQLEALQEKLAEQEDKQNKMYLHMFAKGQEAERMQQADKVMELASGSASRVSVPELLQQLQVTQNELENIKDTNYVQERGNAQVLLSAKEAISLWLLGARKVTALCIQSTFHYLLKFSRLRQRFASLYPIIASLLLQTMYRRLIDAQQSRNKVDPEVTLQFLKSAVYYFLTDKENTRGHLNAIESILGFSDPERKRIEQARSAK